jgi:signal transduction histidine kinase
MADFFARSYIEVYFFYGLSFFCMGLAVLLESGRSSGLDFAKALRPLAGFGLLHGSHEWFEMFLLIHRHTADESGYGYVDTLRIILLASSFFLLLVFGWTLIAGPTQTSRKWQMMVTVVVCWLVGFILVAAIQPNRNVRTIALDVYTRYALAIPGAALTTWGLILQRRKFILAGMKSIGRDVSMAAVAFALYGGIGQLFASSSAIFPSVYLNSNAFLNWFGFPIQAFRGLVACVAAIFIIRTLRAFEVENRGQIETLQNSQTIERQQLEELRSELLHQTVKAQESERQRIASELHDEIGQTLTALGMGLRGLSETITTNPQRAVQHANQLEKLTGNGLEELQNLVTGLYPPQLNELGLLPAIRWYTAEINKRYKLHINITSNGQSVELTEEQRAVLYRIAQEAITNIVRHAETEKDEIRLTFLDSEVDLSIEDDGKGFDVEKTIKRRSKDRPCWGLIGIMERATLIRGTCVINSEPGRGTLIEVTVPIMRGGQHGAD